jgi:hypothetical protein
MPIAQSSSISQVVELNTDNDNLDFENLKLFAIELVQKYSGTIWTDYNLHDPGVTIIEALCFALTDLAYRSNFPINDILTDQYGNINYNDQSFYTIDQILNTNPANLTDLKKVLIDKLDDIQYINFKKSRPNSLSISNRGVYDAFIQLKQNKIEKIHTLKDKSHQTNEFFNISKSINDIFFQYRYLGIALDEVHFLKPREVNILANIIISKDIDPEEILAKIYFEISNYFTNIIKFESPVDLYNKSYDLVDIYDGPKLDKGVIKQNSFQEQIIEANENDVITILKTIPGVKEVVHFSFSEISEKNHFYTIRLEENEYFTINHLSNNNQIKLRTDDHDIKINKIFFENLFNEMVSASRLPNEKEIDEITNKNIQGQNRSIDVYHTIQNYFPIIYGLGLEGVSANEGDQRIASLKQLKAFLSIFEQIMANYLSQLNATSQLFSNSLNEEQASTYFYQSIHQITGLKEILVFFNNIKESNDNLNNEYLAINILLNSLKNIAESDTDFNDRKNAFFDHLLARFNISLNHTPIELYEQYYGNHNISRISNLLLWKSNMLQNITKITKNRFKAPQYSDLITEPDFLSIIYNFLYIQNKPFHSFIGHFTQELDINYNPEIEIINNQKLVLVDEVIPVIDNNSLKQAREKGTSEDYIIFEFQDENVFIDACNHKNYKIIPDVFGTNKFLILFKSKSNPNWRVVSRVENADIANSKINYIINYFITLNKLSEGIHIVENVHLRPNENLKLFGFQILDNNTNKVILKSLNTRNKIDNDIYINDFKNIIASINEENYKEVISNLSKKYLLYDIISSDEEWKEVLIDLITLFNNGISEYRIEYFIATQNNKNINLDFFDYSVFFVLPSWPSRFQDIHFKKIIKNIITEYLPAHLVPHICYLDFTEIADFEKIYFNWTSLLHKKTSKEFQNLSLSLTHFLNSL